MLSLSETLEEERGRKGVGNVRHIHVMVKVMPVGHGANHEYCASVGKQADSRSIAETVATAGAARNAVDSALWDFAGPPAAAKRCRAARRDAGPGFYRANGSK